MTEQITAPAPSRHVTLVSVIGYTVLIGALTAAVLSTVQVMVSSSNLMNGFANSFIALLYAVPVGLVTAFAALITAFCLRSVTIRLSKSRLAGSIAGAVGVLLIGVGVTLLFTVGYMLPVAWIAFAGTAVGATAFFLWSLRCLDKVAALAD
ncbi:hypothetical protein [Leifsonia sp. Leaf264]|uniref:hypothetical protein n=1 Tax=Leifsonia sp. Leaf264 TaxID=1736314 RepID=UPI0006F4792C|nr:hypothetical protein [Leifsonia sp. Leaf264]KQO98519.1 hypothetical protein ASF30_10685 [Leifsonia sp. Leaf264]